MPDYHKDPDIAEPLLPDPSDRGELEEKDASHKEAELKESVLVSVRSSAYHGAALVSPLHAMSSC